jgi:hypothetical protein
MTPLPSPFVLVPGAGGNSEWFWSRVAPHLRAAGHEAVAAELPTGDEDAGLDEYADAIVAAIDGRRGVTVVAQSMGAFCAPLAVARADVAALLLVCPMIPAPGESASDWWDASGQSAARRANEVREGRDPDAPFDEREGFFHDVPAAIVEEAYAGDPPRQADKPFEQPFPLDAWPAVTTRVLIGRRDRLFPYTFMQDLTRDRLGVEADAIDAGHLAALSRPEETADWLLHR